MFWNEFESRQKEREKQAVLHREALRKQQEDNKSKKLQDRIRDITDQHQEGGSLNRSTSALGFSLKQLDNVQQDKLHQQQQHQAYTYQPVSRSER